MNASKRGKVPLRSFVYAWNATMTWVVTQAMPARRGEEHRSAAFDNAI